MSYKKIKAFGLDISDSSIKIVSLNKKKAVEVCLSEKIPAGIVVHAKIKEKQTLSDLITSLIEKAGSKIGTDNVILSLPESKIFAHVFSVPSSLANNAKVILKLAQEHIPLDLNESIFDYKIIKDKELPKKEKRIYFVAVEERLVFDYLEVLTLSKLKPIAIDIEPSSIARALNDPHKKALEKKLLEKLRKKKESAEKKMRAEENKKDKQKQKGKEQKQGSKNKAQARSEAKAKEIESVESLIKESLPSAEIVLDIGDRHSVATIFYNSNVFPSISMPIGGQTFTQIIQNNLSIKDYEEAEKTKHKLTVKSEQYKKVQNNIEAEYDKLIKELQSLIEYFEKNNEVIVKKLHLSGGSIQFNGLYEYFVSNFTFEVVKAEAKIKATKNNYSASSYINAFGLAIRGISGDPVTEEINLLPAHQKKMLVEQQAKAVIIYSSLVVLFVSSLLIASFNIVLSDLYFDLDGLNKANDSFQKIVEGKRYQEIQTHIQAINDSVQLAKQTVSEEYSIKTMYEYFYATLPKTIVLNQFNYDNTKNTHQVKVNGFALNREDVLELQGILQNTSFYYNLVAPLSNLLKQDNIYFAFDFAFDFDKFQEYLKEQKEKEIKAAKKAREEALNGTGAILQNNSNNNSNNPNIDAFKTGDSTNNNNANIGAFNDSDETTIIQLDDNLINTENLEDFNQDFNQLSDNMTETENIEDEQIKEVLENSNEEYPFQDKIHEKVGDIFVIEQQFLPSDNTEE